MEISNLLPITTRKELRIWLENNHLTSSCCWVLTTRKPSPHALLYLDAVEEALCFGWIDSTRKKTASGFLAQRLTPRTRIFYSSFNRIRLFTPISWRFPGYTAMCAWIPFKLKKPAGTVLQAPGKFLKNTRENRMYGEWHDGGRLLEK